MKKLFALAVMCVVCCIQGREQGFANFWNGRLLSGNTIEFSSMKVDTSSTIDPDTNERIVSNTSTLPRPTRLNGKNIQQATATEQGTYPLVIAKASDLFSKYLIDSLRPLLQHLSDGEYFYSPFYTIVNEKGALAYYEQSQGINKTAQPFAGATIAQIEESRHIDEGLKVLIDKKVAMLAEHCASFEILYMKEKAMPYDLGGFVVSVKDHRLQE